MADQQAEITRITREASLTQDYLASQEDEVSRFKESALKYQSDKMNITK